MGEIKRDEMSRLKIFLVFYGALIAYILNRWFAPPVALPSPVAKAGDDAILLLANTVLSLLATVAFVSLFLHKRHSYFAVEDRLHKFQESLRLYEPAEWNSVTFFSTAHRSARVDSWKSWREQTKPFSSFLMRLLYVIVANLCVDVLVLLALRHVGSIQGSCCVVLAISLAIFANAIVCLLVYVHDWHFCHKYLPKSSPSPSP